MFDIGYMKPYFLAKLQITKMIKIQVENTYGKNWQVLDIFGLKGCHLEGRTELSRVVAKDMT